MRQRRVRRVSGAVRPANGYFVPSWPEVHLVNMMNESSRREWRMPYHRFFGLLYPPDDPYLPYLLCLRDGDGLSVRPVGWDTVYDPALIAYGAQYFWAKALSSEDESAWESCRAHIAWLKRHAQELPGGGRGWLRPAELAKEAGLEAKPWLSALSQGRALALYSHLAQTGAPLTFPGQGSGDLPPASAEETREILASFHQPVSRGGFRLELDDRAVWFEEGPIRDGALSLQGHLEAMLGLATAHRLHGWDDAPELFLLALRGLEARLPDFDASRQRRPWTLATTGPAARLSTRVELSHQVAALWVLHEHTGLGRLGEWARRWAEGLR